MCKNGRCRQKKPFFKALSMPATGVTYSNARIYCQSIKKRLPTYNELLYAARGKNDRRIHPWGDDFFDHQAGIAQTLASLTPNVCNLMDKTATSMLRPQTHLMISKALGGHTTWLATCESGRQQAVTRACLYLAVVGCQVAFNCA